MANLKNITDLPVAESADGLNLIVNDNGAAKQIATSAVGAQADWAETDETSPAFIKNKPVEEWDLDITINASMDSDSGNTVFDTIINSGTFDAVKNKVVNGEYNKIRVHLIFPNPEDASMIAYETCTVLTVTCLPDALSPGNEVVIFTYRSMVADIELMSVLGSDNQIITDVYLFSGGE